ncbi:DNA polymerase epsilon subunit B, partial [Guillardia theta CCMP2712]
MPPVSQSKITSELVQEIINETEQRDGESTEAIVIIDHKETPISRYDKDRKVFLREDGSSRSISAKKVQFNRLQAFRERYEIINQRVMRNEIFEKKKFVQDSTYQEISSITSLRRNPGQSSCVLGLLTQPKEGKFHLEDLTGEIEIDLSNADTSVGLFTENCVVVAQGMMKGDIFVVQVLAMPPAEDRKETCRIFPTLSVPTNRKPYTNEELESLRAEESQQAGTRVIVLSDVWLDRAKVMNGLKMMLFRYDSACKEAGEDSDLFLIFVFMGNFTSQPAPKNYTLHRELFDQLGTIIQSFKNLENKSSFIFIPGPNDVLGSNGMILPRNSLPTVITEPFKNKVPSSTFTSDPCRIKFYSQELLFHRDDICSKLRQYSRRPSNTEKSVYEHAAKTILCQGHLCPLPLHVAPIDWNYDHALRMYPLPNVLILGDKASAYTITFKSTQVANPGCFASDFTFYSYDPSIKELELCAL